MRGNFLTGRRIWQVLYGNRFGWLSGGLSWRCRVIIRVKQVNHGSTWRLTRCGLLPWSFGRLGSWWLRHRDWFWRLLKLRLLLLDCIVGLAHRIRCIELRLLWFLLRLGNRLLIDRHRSLCRGRLVSWGRRLGHIRQHSSVVLVDRVRRVRR